MVFEDEKGTNGFWDLTCKIIISKYKLTFSNETNCSVFAITDLYNLLSTIISYEVEIYKMKNKYECKIEKLENI